MTNEIRNEYRRHQILREVSRLLKQNPDQPSVKISSIISELKATLQGAWRRLEELRHEGLVQVKGETPETAVVSLTSDGIAKMIEGNPNRRKIFIGHGQSKEWMVLRDLIEDEFGLEYEEFDREPQAGRNVQACLEGMLENSCFAFLVLTGDDKQEDGTFRARENAIHELGLFQGGLGFSKAIIVVEEGCNLPSNITGDVHFSFRKHDIEACFQKVKRVLRREGVL